MVLPNNDVRTSSGADSFRAPRSLSPLPAGVHTIGENRQHQELKRVGSPRRSARTAAFCSRPIVAALEKKRVFRSG